MFRLLLLMTLFIQAYSYGDIFGYLKKAENKPSGNGIKNIDFIYMINLDQRPEKFEKSMKQLNPYGIFPYRFSAVNGWELSLEDVNNIGLKYEKGMKRGRKATTYPIDKNGKPVHEEIHVEGKTYFCLHLSRGAMGIILSHMSIIQDAYDSGYETIWVMEDDVAVIQDPNKISGLITKLDKLTKKKGWDILFTDPDSKDRNGNYVPCAGHMWRPNFTPKNPLKFHKKTKLGKDFMQIGARFGAYSMIIRRSGMEKLLNFYKTYGMYSPFDMDYCLPEGMRLFSLQYDVVSTTPGAFSDNGRPSYLD